MILHAAVLLLPRERAIIIVEHHAKINNMENKRKALEDDCTQKTALPKVLIDLLKKIFRADLKQTRKNISHIQLHFHLFC